PELRASLPEGPEPRQGDRRTQEDDGRAAAVNRSGAAGCNWPRCGEPGLVPVLYQLPEVLTDPVVVPAQGGDPVNTKLCRRLSGLTVIEYRIPACVGMTTTAINVNVRPYYRASTGSGMRQSETIHGWSAN